MGAERIIAISRHEERQKFAREFGATHIVTYALWAVLENLRFMPVLLFLESRHNEVTECDGTGCKVTTVDPPYA